MFPIQPFDEPDEISALEEKQMAADLAEQLNDYICNELTDKLSEMAAEILEYNGIDAKSDHGFSLTLDLIKRIAIVAN